MSWFAFSFDDAARYDFAPCNLTLLLADGTPLELRATTHRVDLERAFGRPAADLDGGEERTLEFQVGRTSLEVAVDLSGRLIAVDIDSEAPAG